MLQNEIHPVEDIPNVYICSQTRVNVYVYARIPNVFVQVLLTYGMYNAGAYAYVMLLYLPIECFIEKVYQVRLGQPGYQATSSQRIRTYFIVGRG